MAALSAGNMEEAWDLVTQTLELIWLDMTTEIRSAWLTMLDFILNTGSSIASAIGQIFQGLATVLEGMLNFYKKTYNTIYNGVLELGGSLTGVRTIGGSVDAFSADFGGAESAARQGIDSIRTFGEGMQAEAEAQKEDRRKRRHQQMKEREQRKQELQDNLNAAIDKADADKKENERSESEAAQKKAEEKKDAPSEAVKRAGPSGTFSAFAAGIIGATPPVQTVSDNELRKLQRENNKIAREMRKHLKKLDNDARFAA